MRDNIILVAGATGRQGGAALRHLLAAGWGVRGMTRDASKPAAKRLQELGADIVEADMEDPSSLDDACEGCYGVFSVQDYWSAGYDAEIRQGCNLADAAKDARVEHFVYSSVGGADRNTGIPHFQSKWQIEGYIQGLEMPTTILRPVFFMDNFLQESFRSQILSGTLSMPLPDDTPLQMIAVDDIGGFVAHAFSMPQRLVGEALEVAGDELTMPQVAAQFSSIIGRKVRYQSVPLDQAGGEDNQLMFKWFIENGYRADIAGLRSMHPELLTFEQWARRSGWVSAANRAA